MRAVVVVIVFASLLAACGQKGALYLPSQAPKRHAHHAAPAPAPAPAPAAPSASTGTP